MPWQPQVNDLHYFSIPAKFSGWGIITQQNYDGTFRIACLGVTEPLRWFLGVDYDHVYNRQPDHSQEQWGATIRDRLREQPYPPCALCEETLDFHELGCPGGVPVQFKAEREDAIEDWEAGYNGKIGAYHSPAYFVGQRRRAADIQAGKLVSR